MITALTDATIFTGESFIEGHTLLIRDHEVLDIVTRFETPANAKIISHAGKIIAPGFIDAQVNGGGNVMLNNTPTADACLAIARAHRRYGTTRLLLTCISDSFEVTQKAIAAVREARRADKNILGIHIEGPHLGAERRGVHKAEFVRACTDRDLQLYRREGDEIMLITLAPECVPLAQIRQLRDQGVMISIGHTQGAPSLVRGALAVGATGFTHLFNGMGGLSAREQGPANVALDDRASWCSIIADGHHVSAEMFRLALRAKPRKIFLVSDAMPPSASDDPRPFELYGEPIRIENGTCLNGEGKLAGALLTMAGAVRNCVKQFGIGLDESLCMASTYPAAFLGLDKTLGKLLPGYEANMTVLSSDLKPQAPAG